MPFATRAGTRLYWKWEGEPQRSPLVLLNSIGTDLGVWDKCLPLLLPAFRVLRMDTRGHGASDAPPGNYSLAMLADDVAAVMDAAGLERAWIAGVSLGGMMAMRLAIDRPSRALGLVLVCTSAAMDSSAWNERIASVRAGGTAAIEELAMGRLLSPEFARNHPALTATVRGGLLATSAHGYAGAGAAIRDMDLAQQLGELAVPTLVVTGTRDISTPYEPHGRALVEAIRGCSHIAIDAAHLAPLEAPDALVSAVSRFCFRDQLREDAADTLFAAGLANRRRILGDGWVDRSLANRTPFNAEFQAMITRIAWQEIWDRTGLDDRTRRLLVVATTAAMGRWEEFALHVRKGLELGGFTQNELKEVLLQTAIYAGVPAANTAFSEAMKIIAELRLEAPLP